MRIFKCYLFSNAEGRCFCYDVFMFSALVTRNFPCQNAPLILYSLLSVEKHKKS